MVKVSVHIIAKETTNLGKYLFEACLNSIEKANYADEIIIVDNGCRSDIKDSSFAIPCAPSRVVILPSERSNTFTELRNKCLEHTGKDMDFFHWIDTDEIWFPQGLQDLKRHLEATNATEIFTQMHHLMIDPYHYQDTVPKNNIFRFPEDRSKVRWSKDVHEVVKGIDKITEHTNFSYLHWGYCREQWRVCLRWLYYALLEFGSLNCYREHKEVIDDKEQVVDYFRDWRNPNTILEDRKTVWKDYKTGFPTSCFGIFKDFEKSKKDWQDWVASIDDQSFWNHWQELYKKCGNWKDTLKDICKKMGWEEKL